MITCWIVRIINIIIIIIIILLALLLVIIDRIFDIINIKLNWWLEADLGLVKLVVMTNVFFNYHSHETEIKRFICIK